MNMAKRDIQRESKPLGMGNGMNPEYKYSKGRFSKEINF